MANSTFTIGATIAHFKWLHRGPQRGIENNVAVYRGTVLFAMETGAATSALSESELLAGLKRDIIIRPVDSSAGLAAFIDYNGTPSPAGVLILSDGTTMTCVLTNYQRTEWRNESVEAEVEFKRVA